MKTSFFKTLALISVLINFLILSTSFQANAQFQNLYDLGAATNSFTKVIPDGSDFYVLGSKNGNATVSRIDNAGNISWTYVMSISSAWADGIRASNGNLMVVGFTLPFNNSNKSLIGEFDPSGYVCVKSLDEPGLEALSSIEDNFDGTYSALGIHTTISSLQDVVIYNLSPNCNVNLKEMFISPANDNFGNDLLTLSNTDYLVAGKSGSNAVIYQMSGNNFVNGVQGPAQYDYVDLERVGNDILGIANPVGAGQPEIMRFDNNLFPVWEISVNGVTTLDQIVYDGTGDIYVLGTATINSLSRAVVIKINDSSGSPVLVWSTAKYFEFGETGYTGGGMVITPNGDLAFIDGRDGHPNGFGSTDAFFALTDSDMTSECTLESMISITTENTLFDGPAGLDLFEYEFPAELPEDGPTEMWEQIEACALAPCEASFDVTFVDSCGHVQITSTSTGPLPIAYQWCSGENTPNLDLQLLCQPYTYCVTITCADGGTSTASQTFTVSDNIPPTAICVPPFGVDLDANCIFNVTPEMIDGGSFDNCQIQSMSVSPTVLNGCGVFPITLTIIDWCGNISTCSTEIQTIEVIPPTIICPSDTIVISQSETPCSLVVNGIQWLSISDNCGTPAITYNINGATTLSGTGDASGQTFHQGLSTVTYTATDDCGNTASCSFTVTVECDSDNEIDLSCGMAVATCFSGMTSPYPGPVTVIQNAPVIGLFDLRQVGTSGIAGDNWGPPKQLFLEGDAVHCGQVFGIAIDNNGSILTTASTIYGDASNTPGFLWGSGGSGGIYRFTYDNGQWVKQLFLNDIPNFGSGFGNITYDKNHDQFFVTNHLDGAIYRIPNTPYPSVPPPLSYTFWCHAGTATFPSNVTNFCPLGIRTWGIGYNHIEDRVYFAVWSEDVGQNRQSPAIFNEIKSVGLLPNGDFDISSERLEIILPDYPTSQIVNPHITPTHWSNPVSDIEFSENGDMIVAEKTMRNDIGFAASQSPGGGAHYARVFQFKGSSQNWAAPQQIHIGNLEYIPPINGNVGSYNNSAGGVDYGYQDFVNGSLIGCDQLIWGSGDALMYSGHNDYNNSSNTVYGIAAMPVVGNSATHGSINPDWVESSSYYVDLDGDLNSIEKLQIGDVDIYNCPCPVLPDFPCEQDSIMVMYAPVSVPGTDQCCYEVGFKNLANNVTKICANLNTPGWVFNTGAITSGGFTFNTVGTTQLCVDFQNGTIPNGIFQNVLTFCLAETTPNAPPVQQILFEWYQGNNVVCEDIMMTDCVAPINDTDTCLIISNLQTECLNNDLEYCMTFSVTNLNNSNAFGLVLGSLPPGYAYADCGCGGAPYGSNGWQFSGFPLIGANASINLCVRVIATAPVLSATNICFNASLEFGDQCCSSPQDWCAVLEPCCTPCENTLITINEIDSCCYSVDFNYDCDYSYYTHIEFDILTNGVHFGWNANDPNWNVCIPPSTTNVCIEPFAGAIPPGSYQDLFSFCLTDIDMPSEVPQQVQMTFWTIDSNGQDSIACDTILTFDCEPPSTDTCVFVTNEEIICIPDSIKYQITVTVQNLSVPNFSASFLGITGPGISPNPIPLVPPLDNDGSVRTVSFCYTPAPWPDSDGQLTLIYNLKNFTQDTCCNGNQTFIDTILLPPCDTCVCSIPELNMTTTGGSNFSLTCNENDPDLWPVLACQSGDVTIAGNIGCTPMNGATDCPPEINWWLSGPNGPITNGSTTSGNISFTFPAAQVSAPGNYTFVSTTLCPGALEACACYINWIQEACDPCCTDSLAFINTAMNVQTNGILGDCMIHFDATGMDSCMQISYVWGDIPPGVDGPYGDNTEVWHTYAGPGTYNVCYFIEEINASDSICWTYEHCEDILVLCDDCECEGYWDTEFIGDWGPVSVNCNNSTPVQLACPGQQSWFHGNTACIDSCLLDSVNWDLQFGGTSVFSGAVLTYFLPGGNVGHFDIPFDDSFFTQSGTYTLTVVSHCNGNECPCVVTFTIPPCSSDCSCDEPIFPVSPTTVKSIFNVTSNAGCSKNLYPAFNLTPCDDVFWTYHTSTNSVFMGTSTGNGSLLFTFPSAGTYTVCMNIIRMEPDGTVCEEERCQKVVINCGIFPDCANPKLFNPGFFEGAVAGDMNGGTGLSEGWFAAFGNPEVITEEGCGDEVYIRLEGNQVMADGLSTSTLDLEPGLQYSITFCYRKRKWSCERKDDMIVRLSDTPQGDVECSGNCIEIGEYDLEGEEDVWYDFVGFFSPDQAYNTLTIHIKNGSALPANLSAFDIDNLCIQPFDFVSADEVPVNSSNIRLFPNPTTGMLNIQFEKNSLETGVVQIFDLWGRTVHKEKLPSGQQNHELSISNLSAGIYFIKITENRIPVWADKIIKQ